MVGKSEAYNVAERPKSMLREQKQILLTIAGHDPSTGAGATADLLTFASHGFFGTSALTALTAQSTLQVASVHVIEPAVLAAVLAELEKDLPPAGVKVGMLGSLGAVEAVCGYFKRLHEGRSPEARVRSVLDPVLLSSSGAALLEVSARDALSARLLPLVDWVTPNHGELAALTHQPVNNLDEAQLAMHALGRRYPHLSIVATGGDQADPVDLVRLPDGSVHVIPGEHVETTSTHGTGCAFSSALLCGLMQGLDPVSAVASAKVFVTEALRRAPGLGGGRGPLNLLWPMAG